jgi:DNA repair protein RadC
VVNVDLIALGSVNTVYAPTREVLQPVVKNGALFFILVHNHPDGKSHPSKEDILFTRKIEQAAQLLDVELLDHVIIGTDGYFSFKENGLL